MKRSRNLSLFRIVLLLFLNVYFKNLPLLLVSIVYLLIVGKSEVLIFLVLLFSLLIKLKYATDLIPIGYVESRNDNYLIVDKILYKVKCTDVSFYPGDIVYFESRFDPYGSLSELKRNILYENDKDLHLITDKTPLKNSYRHLQAFDPELSAVFKRVLFNEYVNENDLDVYLGYGFCFYYLLRKIFVKNRFLSVSLMFLYSFFFGFELKFYLIIIDLLLSFTHLSNINKLSLKILSLIYLNHCLLLNNSILIPLFFTLLNYLESNDKFIISLMQSFLFGGVSIFISFFFEMYIYMQISLFLMAFIMFALPVTIVVIFPLLSFVSSILKYASFQIRGKISVFTIIFLVLFHIFYKKKSQYVYTALLLLCLMTPINNPLKHVSFIDIGQGDSILIKGALNKYNVLIDTGSSYNYSKLKSFLFNEGIYKIDYLILTHDDSDHNGNAVNLNYDFKIENVITDHTDVRIKDLFLENIYVGSFDNDNDNSLVYYSVIDDYAFLFTGDIGSDVERKMISLVPFDHVDVLKVSHHGSRSATSDYFIRKTLPRFAVISTNGNYGHPHEEVMDTLRSYKVDTYVTRNCGTVTFYLSDILDFIKTANNDFDIIRS